VQSREIDGAAARLVRAARIKLQNVTGQLLAFVGGAACIAGGVYMLAFHSEAAASLMRNESTVFDVLTHGIGIYCIGKGVSVWGLAILSPGEAA
jgi:hypothetical protein